MRNENPAEGVGIIEKFLQAWLQRGKMQMALGRATEELSNQTLL